MKIKVNFNKMEDVTDVIKVVQERNGKKELWKFADGKSCEANRNFIMAKYKIPTKWLDFYTNDTPDEEIAEDYPELVKHADQIMEGRKGRGKDKNPRHRRTREEIEKSYTFSTMTFELKQTTKERIETLATATGISVNEYITNLVENDLKEKEEIIDKIKELQDQLRGKKC